MAPSSSSSSSSSRTPTKRLLTELSAFNAAPPSSHPFIVSLAPQSSSSLLQLRAVLHGAALPASTGYHSGRWLLAIAIPAGYPNQAPTIRFETRICHPNVDWRTGEVCLDLLKEAWTPVLGVVGALEAVGRLLGEPGVESPLGVEVAALLRDGDALGARGLVGFWCAEERFEGEVGEEEEEGERERERERERR